MFDTSNEVESSTDGSDPGLDISLVRRQMDELNFNSDSSARSADLSQPGPSNMGLGQSDPNQQLPKASDSSMPGLASSEDSSSEEDDSMAYALRPWFAPEE